MIDHLFPTPVGIYELERNITTKELDYVKSLNRRANSHNESSSNNYILNETDSNEFAKIFVPDVENNKKNGWQGRLCWNTPFICSYNKLEVKRKNGYLMIIKIYD